MDIVENRRENLRRWVAEHGTPAKEKSLFSQLKSTGSFGERVARRLEQQYKMGAGYLDAPPKFFVSHEDDDSGGQREVVELLREVVREKGAVQEKRLAQRAQPEVRSPVLVYDPEDGVADDMVLVPESRIEFAGGDGRINYELVDEHEPATYRRAWFQKYGINPDHVRRFRVSGDSMEPLLFARDTILVNLDETEVIDGRLYALRYGDQLRVKYLSKRIDGTLVLRSVNPSYKDEEVSAELANEHITIIGRVRDRSGTGGL